jgi:hypothetical protein
MEKRRFLCQEIPCILWIRRFTNEFRKTHHFSLSRTTSDEFRKNPPLVLIPNHVSSWRSVLILSSHLHLGPPMISFWYVLLQIHRKEYDKDKMFNVIDRNYNCWYWKSCVKHTYSVGKRWPSGAFASLHNACKNRYWPSVHLYNTTGTPVDGSSWNMTTGNVTKKKSIRFN